MASDAAERFMRALQETERTRDVGPLVARFADGAALRKQGRGPAQGGDAPRQFWQEYLDAFQHIRSEFTAVTEGDGRAVLEWVSEGALADGHPIRYEGVSVLELDGEKVRTFRTYFDSAAFLAPVVAGQATQG